MPSHSPIPRPKYVPQRPHPPSPNSQPPASATVTYIYSQTPSMERSLNYFFIGHIVLFMSDLSHMRRGLSAQPLPIPIPTSVTVTAHRPPLPLRRTDVRQSGLRPSCSFVLSHVPLLWAAEVRWQCSGSDAPLPPPPGSLRQ